MSEERVRDSCFHLDVRLGVGWRPTIEGSERVEVEESVRKLQTSPFPDRRKPYMCYTVLYLHVHVACIVFTVIQRSLCGSGSLCSESSDRESKIARYPAGEVAAA